MHPSFRTASARTRTVDLLVVILAAALTLALIAATGGEGPALLPQFSFWPFSGLRYVLGLFGVFEPWTVAVLACGALWWRRRCPTVLAVALTVAGLVLPTVVPATVAVFSVAAYRPARTTAWVSGVAAAPVLAHFALLALDFRAAPVTLEALAPGLVALALIAGAVGWGLFVRSLHERAERAEAEAALRAERAQRAVREEIAREMHDVLAHRLSLLSVHAGALEFNPSAPADQIEHAASVIRESAHRALQELRTVIGVLRAPTAEEQGAPVASLGDLPRLLEESRGTGMRVEAGELLADLDAVPALTGRTAYRIVQEGLTNARKHAPGAVVRVTVAGGPKEGLTVELRNPAPQDVPQPAIPGGGHGLTGLAERASLAGGRLEHGRDGGDYRLRAWLPWVA